MIDALLAAADRPPPPALLRIELWLVRAPER